MKFSAVILAGGESSRMGRDKAFLEIGGQTLLARQIRVVREAGADEVFISGRVNAEYAAYGCRVLLDQFPGAGPLAGIERALAAAAAPLLLVLAVDVPEMNAAFIRTLAARCSHDVGAVPCIGEKVEPLAGFYPKSARNLAEALLRTERNGVAAFAKDCAQAGYIRFFPVRPDQTKCFTNWNHPADIAVAPLTAEHD